MQILIAVLVAYASHCYAQGLPSDPVAVGELVLRESPDKIGIEDRLDTMALLWPEEVMKLVDWINRNPRVLAENWAEERLLILIRRSVEAHYESFADPLLKARFARETSRFFKHLGPADPIAGFWIDMKYSNDLWAPGDLRFVQRTFYIHGPDILGPLHEFEKVLSVMDVEALRRTVAFVKWDKDDGAKNSHRAQYELVKLLKTKFVRGYRQKERVLDEQVEDLPNSPLKEICKVACNGLSPQDFVTTTANLVAFNRQYLQGDWRTHEMFASIGAHLRDDADVAEVPLARFLANLKSGRFTGDECDARISRRLQ